jgi:hypothetical protein
MDEYRQEGSFFWALNTSDYDFKPTDKPGRIDRMDALCVSHGYPLSVFADLPDMFNQYISVDLGASPLHLQCCWRKLPAIHTLTDEQRDLEQARKPLFDKLCKDCGDEAGNKSGGGGPTVPNKPKTSKSEFSERSR